MEEVLQMFQGVDKIYKDVRHFGKLVSTAFAHLFMRFRTLTFC